MTASGSPTLVLQKKVKTCSEGYLGHGGEGIGGERNFGFNSEAKIELQHGGERDGCRMRTLGGAAPPPPEESAYDREVGTMECHGPEVN